MALWPGTVLICQCCSFVLSLNCSVTLMMICFLVWQLCCQSWWWKTGKAASHKWCENNEGLCLHGRTTICTYMYRHIHGCAQWSFCTQTCEDATQKCTWIRKLPLRQCWKWNCYVFTRVYMFSVDKWNNGDNVTSCCDISSTYYKV